MSIKSYKGFNTDMTCRGFQFEEGKEYEIDGKIEACERGFHACEAPIDCFSYYPPITSVYHEVEQDGEISKKGNDTKIASSKIKIGARLDIAGIVNAQIEWVKSNTKKARGNHSKIDYGAASATGDQGAAMASGKEGRVKAVVGCAIFGCERGEWDGKSYPIISVASAIVDGEKIKADTWYTVKNGEFVEVTND